MPLRLTAGAWSATLLPEQGGALARLDHARQPVLLPLPEGANPNTSRAGAFWMIPWANRMDAGQLGDGLRVPVNLLAEHNAIHGLSRDRPWQLVSASGEAAILEQRVEAEGYAYRARARFRLGRAGLALDLVIENGGAARPFGLGWHPWFARRAGQRLRFAATHRLTCDERLLPIAAEATAGIDAEAASLVGADAHFGGWNGSAAIIEQGSILALRATGAWAGNLQLYVPEKACAICLEPSSHIPNAPNRPGLAWLGGMTDLGLGQRLAAGLTIAIGRSPGVSAIGR